MQALLGWTRALAFGEAFVLSLLVNVIVFVLAIGIGGLVVRLWCQRPVAGPPPAVTLGEGLLAASCIVLNSGVMFAGWLLFRSGLLRVDGDALGWRSLADALVLVLVMDFAMYVTHRIAHHPIAFRWVHGIHHRYDAPRPLTLFVLHPVEVVGFGGLWILTLCSHAFSLGGMLGYLTVNTLFGVLGHVGVEPLPRAWSGWPVARNIGTSTFHARHHQTPTSNYGFYSTLWDQLFGTLDAGYRARFGRPR